MRQRQRENLDRNQSKSTVPECFWKQFGSSPIPLKIHATNWVTNREEGFDTDSLKCRIATLRLEQRLPRRQPNPQDSPSSNRKHLFRSDKSAECLWGPSLQDIKRLRKKSETQTERDGEAALRHRGRQEMHPEWERRRRMWLWWVHLFERHVQESVQTLTRPTEFLHW